MFRNQINKIKEGFNMSDLIDLNDLTQEEMKKVKNFIISLKNIRSKAPAKTFNFKWAGGLKDAFGGKSSVELQHENTNWR
jgi:hypothetical protein